MLLLLLLALISIAALVKLILVVIILVIVILAINIRIIHSRCRTPPPTPGNLLSSARFVSFPRKIWEKVPKTPEFSESAPL